MAASARGAALQHCQSTAVAQITRRRTRAVVEEAGSWRAQPSRTPSQRLGARRERATERDREDGAEQSRRSYSLVSAGEIEAIAWRRLQSKVGGIRRIGH